MAAKRISDVPRDVPIRWAVPPHGLYIIGYVEDRSRYYCSRQSTPSFLFEIEDGTLIDEEAGKIINAFLEKMHRYGHRNV